MEEQEFQEVWRWVLSVGDSILGIYKTDFQIRDKGGNDPVTEADLYASEFLYEKISNRFPGHGFLSEERADTVSRLDKEWVWILDPIDGTREFVKKNDQFALSLGLVRNGEAIWGIIFNPATGEFFSKGKNSFFAKLQAPYATDENFRTLLVESGSVLHPLQESDSQNKKPVLIVSASEMREGLFDDSFWHEDFEIRSMGSIAYKLGLLSAGFIDLIVSLKPKNEWDICGGIALLDEENFTFFPLKDKPYSFNQKTTLSFGLVAGKRKAVEYLESKIDFHQLSLKVKERW
ncbi:3'(2'),5'-bisphosphate nucleotidase CysQ [Leptospira levettii]|uniref:3'(2'),5'-bisphosphate nucleotidase CysQ n=1 Tax=Leptospira levettii TaxID=2023178 RepID=UPI000C297B39|nr:3'(2'),5'-bisphosphate nucleotidase CysQ [Leptospira levettii]PKA26937.1 3'(2'),5'-bisphosphate nucleotidase CysQ [Leptospira sp. mixed culture ATI2-C-A1]MCG6148842.1 3'(2'),5'-bisphosphate nucleotidase CysQ [Leptospira levettii]MCW7472453.1 3'(2'),5'-bisphosphate nucleotidase CysQ [Leptospira levettii]MCW7498251.1 3'(2'),5'-bisphosphate nucleotidase CysQ [Leptospira levettii]MCW7508881.1 3'(2'),5'-bisphosphate nucleotidase CysQ [Leptospira levettii]